MPVFELDHIVKRFQSTVALDDVSLRLSPGERVALVGENGAGKTTLMNVLYGLYPPDGGTLRVDGKPSVLRSPKDALARGIGMVHQHFTLVPTLTVTENVVLGAEPRRGPWLDRQAARTQVEESCKRFGFALDPDARVGTLTVGAQQKVEILKALHRGAQTLILDEPTAVLTPQEAHALFGVARELSEQGRTVVLISHKLRDVLAFATRIVVLRRGKKVAEVAPGAATAAKLAALMIGAAAPGPSFQDAASATEGGALPTAAMPVAIRLHDVSASGLPGVSFEVRSGEILGVAGVDGNGQRELAEVLTGLREFSGEFWFEGKRVGALSTKAAQARGIAHIPEDRLAQAVIGALSVEENVALGRQAQPPFAKGPLIDFAGRRARSLELLTRNDVRPPDPAARMGDLSGGNQQKVVVARELDRRPKVLVAVQPTRGLDLKAVAAVHASLRAQAARGCAVVLMSLDLDEVLELSDRVVVLFGGRTNGEFARGAADELTLGRRMLGTAP